MVVPLPSGAKPLHTLKPSTQGMLRTVMTTAFTATAFFRLQPHRSMAKLMMFSNTAMMVDSAAKVMNRKNSAPHRRPPAIWLKTLGRVTKTRPGPSPLLTPKAEQAGKMIRPDIRATLVSSRVTLMASPVRRRSRPI